MNVKLVVGLAGMPGAGKSVVVRAAKVLGYDIMVMGDVVREETRKIGLELNPENLGNIMLKLRQEEGPAVIAKRCILRIRQAKGEKIMIDGVRSLEEVEEFRKHFPHFSLLAVHASPETRFKRLHHRRRSDDPESLATFNKRDLRELNVGLGKAIAMAEYVILNEKDLDAVKERAKKVLERIEKKWMKQKK